MEFTILGPLAVSHEGTAVPLGSRKQRAVLAILLLRANEVVAADAIIDELWGESSPPSASHTLQAYISRLRGSLRATGAPDGTLVTRAPGYMLRVGFGELDLDRFEALVAEGRRSLEAGSAARAAEKLRDALALWHGPALADLAYESFARIDVERLEEQRLTAVEDRIEADLALRREGALIAELKGLVERHPLRERLREQLMLALYRDGRQADALASYRDAREYFAGELGLEPSKRLRALEQAVLQHDASLDPAAGDERGPVLTATAGGGIPGAGVDRGSHAEAGAPQVCAAGRPAGSARPNVRRGRRALAGLAAAVVVMGGALLVLTRGGAPEAEPVAASALRANAIVIVGARGDETVVQPVAGGRPAGLSAGAGALWASDGANDRVLKLDLRSRRIDDRIPVGRNPTGIVASSHGVWVANTGGGTVSEINPGSGTVVATVRVGNAPVALAVGQGAVWVADASDGTVTRISSATAVRIATIQLGQPLSDVAFGMDAVWATSAASGLLFRIDPHDNRIVEALSVGNGANAIAIASDAVWVANPPDGTVSRIDPQSGAIRKINVAHPGDLAGETGAVWVARPDALDVTRIDTATAAVVETVPIGAPVVAVAATSGTFAVATLATVATHRGGALRVVAGTGLDSIDPGEAWSAADWQVLSLTNDGLLTYGRAAGPGGASIVPDLALSLPVRAGDGRTFTFRLRRGVRYSTGAAVRPADFRTALERQYRAGTGLAAMGVPIRGADRCTRARCDLSEGITVDASSRAVTFHLTRADPQFLSELALPFGAAVPAGSPPIGAVRGALPATGPYRIERYLPGRRVVLRRNPHFRAWSDIAQPPGFPDSITLTLGLDDAHQSAAVANGVADVMLDSPPASTVARLARRLPLQLHAFAQPALLAMFLNTRRPPFDRPETREALALAVDRAAIVRIAGGSGVARATCQILPPGFPGYRPYCPSTADPGPGGVWHAPDLTRSRTLIARSGTSGTAVVVSTVRDDRAKLETGRYFVGLLRQLGYRATLRTYASNHAYYSAVGMERTGSQMGVFNWMADYQAGSAFFQPLFTCASYRPSAPGNMNASGTCEPELDRQIAAATRLQATNAAAANVAWQRIDRAISARSPLVPLVNPVGVDFVSPRVGNYQRHPTFGILLDQLWVR